MSNSKSTDWITFANRLKDFIDSVAKLFFVGLLRRYLIGLLNWLISPSIAVVHVFCNDRNYGQTQVLCRAISLYSRC